MDVSKKGEKPQKGEARVYERNPKLRLVMHFLKALFFILLICSGCQQAALVLHQQKITPNYLASTNVGSPDPRPPPNGQMIVAEWWLPRRALDWNPVLRLDIIFKDYSHEVVEFPIRSTFGYETYSVLNRDFKCTGGFLAYKAEIFSEDCEILAEWKHQLWVRLITIEDDLISADVVEKSMQGSVTEIPGCNPSN